MTSARRWRFAAALIGLVTFAGCTPAPDLRVIDGGMTSVSVAQGRGLLEQGRAAEAVTAFRARLRDGGPDLQVLNGLAIAYGELGRPDLAADMFGRALSLAPDDPATLNNIGFAALRRGDARLARRYLELARNQEAGLAEIEGNLAGVGVFEAMESKRPRGPDLKAIALAEAADRSAQVVRLSLPAMRQEPSAVRPAMQAAPPPPVMIDFTTVIDPFAGRRHVEQAVR